MRYFCPIYCHDSSDIIAPKQIAKGYKSLSSSIETPPLITSICTAALRKNVVWTFGRRQIFPYQILILEKSYEYVRLKFLDTLGCIANSILEIGRSKSQTFSCMKFRILSKEVCQLTMAQMTFFHNTAI